MRIRLSGDKQDYLVARILNSGDETIEQGAPVFQDVSVGDGLSCKSAESLPDAEHAFQFGLAVNACAVGEFADSIVSGFFDYGRILLRSRAASTDDWPGIDAFSYGAPLGVVTQVGAQALMPMGIGGVTDKAPFAVLADTITAVASVASATSDTALHSVAFKRVSLRMF